MRLFSSLLFFTAFFSFLILCFYFFFLSFMCRTLTDGDTVLIYRHYATLYFVFAVDSSESELGILDLIQVLVLLLDLLTSSDFFFSFLLF